MLEQADDGDNYVTLRTPVISSAHLFDETFYASTPQMEELGTWSAGSCIQIATGYVSRFDLIGGYISCGIGIVGRPNGQMNVTTNTFDSAVDIDFQDGGAATFSRSYPHYRKHVHPALHGRPAWSLLPAGLHGGSHDDARVGRHRNRTLSSSGPPPPPPPPPVITFSTLPGVLQQKVIQRGATESVPVMSRYHRHELSSLRLNRRRCDASDYAADLHRARGPARVSHGVGCSASWRLGIRP